MGKSSAWIDTVHDVLGKIEHSKRLVNAQIIFAPDSWELSSAAEATIKQIADALRSSSDSIHVIGTADEPSAKLDTRLLAARRASVTAAALVASGIDPSEISLACTAYLTSPPKNGQDSLTIVSGPGIVVDIDKATNCTIDHVDSTGPSGSAVARELQGYHRRGAIIVGSLPQVDSTLIADYQIQKRLQEMTTAQSSLTSASVVPTSASEFLIAEASAEVRDYALQKFGDKVCQEIPKVNLRDTTSRSYQLSEARAAIPRYLPVTCALVTGVLLDPDKAVKLSSDSRQWRPVLSVKQLRQSIKDDLRTAGLVVADDALYWGSREIADRWGAQNPQMKELSMSRLTTTLDELIATRAVLRILTDVNRGLEPDSAIAAFPNSFSEAFAPNVQPLIDAVKSNGRFTIAATRLAELVTELRELRSDPAGYSLSDNDAYVFIVSALRVKGTQWLEEVGTNVRGRTNVAGTADWAANLLKTLKGVDVSIRSVKREVAKLTGSDSVLTSDAKVDTYTSLIADLTGVVTTLAENLVPPCRPDNSIRVNQTPCPLHGDTLLLRGADLLGKIATAKFRGTGDNMPTLLRSFADVVASMLAESFQVSSSRLTFAFDDRIRLVAFATDFAAATNEEDAVRALETYSERGGTTYRGKRPTKQPSRLQTGEAYSDLPQEGRGAGYAYIDGYAGIVAPTIPRAGGNNPAVGAFLPLGIEVGVRRACGVHWICGTLGIFAGAFDFSQTTSEQNGKSRTGLSRYWAPTTSLVYGFLDSPFSIGAGYRWNAGPDRRSQAIIYAGVDVPLLPIASHIPR